MNGPMFTGIVTDIGEVVRVELRGDTRFTVATAYQPESIAVGASIACSGCCLTAIEMGRSKHGPAATISVVHSPPIAMWDVR